MSNFALWEGGAIVGQQLYADVADVGHVVNAAVVPTFVGNSEYFQHFHHSADSLPYLDQLEEGPLYVDVPLEVRLQRDALVLGLEPQAGAEVPVPTGDDYKVVLPDHGRGAQPLIEFCQSLLDGFSLFDHFLGYSCELGAEGTESRVECWFYISVEGCEFRLLSCVHEDNGKFNYLRTWIYSLIFDASCLEIQNKKILDFSLNDFTFFGNILLLLFKSCILWINKVLNSIDFFLGKGRSMFPNEFYTDIADVQNIINSAMMLALVFQIQRIDHFHHS